MEKGWTKISSYQFAHIAELMKVTLEDSGIAAVVMSKQDSSLHLFGLHELYVHVEDAVQAIQLLEDAIENPELD
jgi:hypothetical protein